MDRLPSAGPLGSSTAPAEPSRASGSGPGVYPAAGSRIVWVDLDRHTEFTYHGDPSVKIYTFGFSGWVVGIADREVGSIGLGNLHTMALPCKKLRVFEFGDQDRRFGWPTVGVGVVWIFLGLGFFGFLSPVV